MHKLFCFLFAVLVISACSPIPKFHYKGYFETGRYPDKHYFATDLQSNSAKIAKVTEGFKRIYVWKTIKYNKKVSEQESFLSYRTFLQAEFDTLSPEQERFVRGQENLLNNYLIFLDDYRFVYLSRDDQRTDPDLGEILLYFKRKQYPLKSPLKDIYYQFLRGYYSVRGEKILLEFDAKNHFYVKASLSGNSIQFDEIYIPPWKTNLKKQGSLLNLPYVPFSEIFDSLSQPVFELPNEKDRDFVQSMYLNFGFHTLNRIIKRNKHPLHQQLDEIAKTYYGNKKISYTRILDITYDLKKLERIYTFQFKLYEEIKDSIVLQTSKKHTLSESLTNISTW